MSALLTIRPLIVRKAMLFCIVLGVGCSRAAESPVEPSVLMTVPDFTGASTLTFRHPADWYALSGNGLVTVAPFPPPHLGMAGALPNMLTITILPYRTALADEASGSPVHMSNGTWVNSFQVPDGVEFYVSDEMPLSVVAAYPDAEPMTESDRALIRDLCESLSLGEELKP